MTIVEALYKCFTNTIIFPKAGEEKYYRALSEIGYIEEATQGHAVGFRILPRGYEAAMAFWGHEQK